MKYFRKIKRVVEADGWPYHRYSRNRTPYHVLFFFTINGGQISSYSSTKLLRFKPCFLLLSFWKRLKRAYFAIRDIVDHTDHKKKKHHRHKSNSFTINLLCEDYRNLEYKVNEHSSVWETGFTWVSLRQVSRLHCWQQYLLQNNRQRKVLAILTDQGWEIKLRRSDLKIRL